MLNSLMAERVSAPLAVTDQGIQELSRALPLAEAS